MSGHPIIKTSELDPSERDEICRLLREFNRHANPRWWATRDQVGDAIPLTIVARGKDDVLVGGLIGETQLSWLKIHLMVVRSEFRRQGIGRKMLRAAEEEGIVRGCRYAYVDTMEYQAPQFYLAYGYDQSGAIADWDSHGHSKFYFTKRLSR